MLKLGYERVEEVEIEEFGVGGGGGGGGGGGIQNNSM